jgi:hypothetical protein
MVLGIFLIFAGCEDSSKFGEGLSRSEYVSAFRSEITFLDLPDDATHINVCSREGGTQEHQFVVRFTSALDPERVFERLNPRGILSYESKTSADSRDRLRTVLRRYGWASRSIRRDTRIMLESEKLEVFGEDPSFWMFTDRLNDFLVFSDG